MTTPNEALGGPGGNAASDPLPEATGLVRGAAEAGHQLKILGGLGVRVLCPDFPPRLRAGQDIDLACMGKNRRKVAAHLESAGCEPDRRFNNLNGDRQMYFIAPSGSGLSTSWWTGCRCATRWSSSPRSAPPR